MDGNDELTVRRGGGGGVGADLVARTQPVGEVRGGERLAGLLLLGADDHRAAYAGEELDFEQLLHAGRELEQAGGLAGPEVDHRDAAEELGVALLDGQAAEDVLFADLAHADQ